MANILKASDDVVELFEKVRATTNIPHWVEFQVLSNDKQKELYKITKLNDVVEVLTEGLNFAVIFNEEILDGLTDKLQEMSIIECLGGVSVSDSDAISLEKPDFNTYSGVLHKYGYEEILILNESIKSLFDAKKQREDDEKAAKKGGKRNSNG